jgi:hypothetical protein
MGKKLTTSAIAAMLGKLGGSVTSPAKAKAAKANGKLGGRPRNKPDRRRPA